MNSFNLFFKPLGKSALLIEWPNRIDETILIDIVELQSKLEKELMKFITEIVNAYNSLTLIFKPDLITLADLEEKIKQVYLSDTRTVEQQKRIWKIPVCYDEEFGIDLTEIAKLKKLAIDEIIAMHCEPEYIVYFTGFLPGFLYLGGLSEKLNMPRKPTPRLRITKGAVAIGGEQTGIYPSESPGGWNIIGNSPLVFFNPMQEPPCFAKTADHLKFHAINRHQYEEIKEAILKDTFENECEIK